MWKAQTGPVRPSKALRLCSAPLTARMGLLLAERAPRVGRDAALVGIVRGGRCRGGGARSAADQPVC